MYEIKEKVALITGGTRGIGLSIAKALLENGVKGVALVARNSEHGNLAVVELSKKFTKDRVIFINADVSIRSQFKDAFEKTIETFKQVDIVVNNAGVIEEMQWENCIATNLQGCITGSLLALDKYFSTTSWDNEKIILNVSSVLGLTPTEFLPVYSATKQGIITFSRSISGSKRCPNLKVKVLVICPGLTTNSSSLGKVDGHRLHENLQELYCKAVEASPLQTYDEMAQHAIGVIHNGETGSVWIINGNTSEEIMFPTITNLL